MPPILCQASSSCPDESVVYPTDLAVYVQIVSEAQRSALPIEQVERQILGGSHGELAACLLGKWGLPGAILEAIAWHHCPANSADSKFSALTAVHMANAFAHETPSTSRGPLVDGC